MDTITFAFVVGLLAVALLVTVSVRRDFLNRQELRRQPQPREQHVRPGRKR